MIDRIVGYNGDDEVYMSDMYPYCNYIGYENRSGDIILYE